MAQLEAGYPVLAGIDRLPAPPQGEGAAQGIRPASRGEAKAHRIAVQAPDRYVRDECERFQIALRGSVILEVGHARYFDVHRGRAAADRENGGIVVGGAVDALHAGPRELAVLVLEKVRPAHERRAGRVAGAADESAVR